MKTVDCLVACSDLTGYTRLANANSDTETFRILSDYYEFVGDTITPAGGTVIKFMGDAALMVFPETSVDTGVLALLSLRDKGDHYLSSRGLSCRHHIRAHFGAVVMGELGTRTDKKLDILGSEVNALFLLKATGFAITAEAFRKLKHETRVHFKKHTPPITYIPVIQPHKD